MGSLISEVFLMRMHCLLCRSLRHDIVGFTMLRYRRRTKDAAPQACASIKEALPPQGDLLEWPPLSQVTTLYAGGSYGDGHTLPDSHPGAGARQSRQPGD